MAQAINGSLVKIAGGHTLKLGGEFRELRLNFYQYTYPSGTFYSDDSWTRQYPQTYDGSTGFSIASLLLGLPQSGDITDDPSYVTTSQYWAFYGQDDWKVSPKLTLNIGLRYDFEVPREEQNNQMVFWNPTRPLRCRPTAARSSSEPVGSGEILPVLRQPVWSHDYCRHTGAPLRPPSGAGAEDRLRSALRPRL